ncbi:MAG: hypothetical protein GXP34_09385 [Actinobacteria bacterium]|nr:hypothetical protein [Actinomycetota bacterium]
MLKRVSVISSIALAVLLIAGLAYAATAPASTNDTATSVSTTDSPSASADGSTSTTAEAADDNSQETTSSVAGDGSATATSSSSDNSTDDSLESADPQPSQVAPTGGIFPVDEAGTVEIAVGDTGLELVSATPNDGFEVSSTRTEPHGIDVKFRNGSLEVEFEAELENGTLNVKVSRETADDVANDDQTRESDHPSTENSSTEDSTSDHPSTENSSTEGSTDTTPAVDMTKTYTVGTAGSVQIKVSGGSLELLDATPNAGWEITETRTEADQIKIEFTNGSENVEFEAELDHGQLQTKTEIKNNDSEDERSDGSSSNNS